MREVAQADAAKAELTVDSPRTAAAVAARVLPRLELLRPRCFRDHAFLRHARTPLLLCPEWKAELAQERESLLVRVGASRDRDVETPDGLHVVVIDFRKDDLLADAKRIVPASVEARRRETSEVADARQRDRDKSIEELPHAGAPKRDLGPDRHPFANLESGDRLLRAGHLRALAGDQRQLVDCLVERARVDLRVADAHVQRDLVDALLQARAISVRLRFLPCFGHQRSPSEQIAFTGRENRYAFAFGMTQKC